MAAERKAISETDFGRVSGMVQEAIERGVEVAQVATELGEAALDGHQAGVNTLAENTGMEAAPSLPLFFSETEMKAAVTAIVKAERKPGTQIMGHLHGELPENPKSRAALRKIIVAAYVELLVGEEPEKIAAERAALCRCGHQRQVHRTDGCFYSFGADQATCACTEFEPA